MRKGFRRYFFDVNDYFLQIENGSYGTFMMSNTTFYDDQSGSDGTFMMSKTTFYDEKMVPTVLL